MLFHADLHRTDRCQIYDIPGFAKKLGDQRIPFPIHFQFKHAAVVNIFQFCIFRNDLLQSGIFRRLLYRSIPFRIFQTHLCYIFIDRLLRERILTIIAILIHLLLQQTGVAFSGLVYIFYKGTPRFAQIQISAFCACLRKRLLIMALENLPDSGF